MRATFRSLRGRNYRIWAMGALVSNVGTWMQRTAQDWIVLTMLTDHSATAVGIVMGLQFGPQMLLLPITGLAADRLDRRKLLMCTQAMMGLLAAVLGLLTLSGLVHLWHVYVFAFLLGCTSAFDAPARQTFVSELVGEEDLPNAVGLNSASFNAARMIGPASAGVLIAGMGAGWVFLLNAASFVAVLVSLRRLSIPDLHRRAASPRGASGLAEGAIYVWKRPDLKAALLMLFVFATFGLNFPIFISTMAVGVFHLGASAFGLLSSAMAIGSVTGALMSAGRAQPQFRFLVLAASVFGGGCLLAAASPNEAVFACVLVVLGLCAQTFNTTTNTLVQLGTEPAMRGRVMAILLALLLGGTPLGAPLIGYVADTCGARWAMVVGAAAGALVAAIGMLYLRRAGPKASQAAA
ncbi:MFS transporter [Xylophilus rhododendri]|uniref:MFS transporter n=1 Tax=Xylophilus rhododendri TaxID=2697032 RepID=A0A857JCP4_9BURK|nr:MFS transporter [Xylophilus rhododendri]QHJ00870.1 MFS transporter [Xylophilus rhododendri]